MITKFKSGSWLGTTEYLSYLNRKSKTPSEAENINWGISCKVENASEGDSEPVIFYKFDFKTLDNLYCNKDHGADIKNAMLSFMLDHVSSYVLRVDKAILVKKDTKKLFTMTSPKELPQGINESSS